MKLPAWSNQAGSNLSFNVQLYLAAARAIGADAALGVVQRAADSAAQCDRSDGNAGTDDGEDESIFSCRSAAVVTQERSYKFTHNTTPLHSLRVSPPGFVPDRG